ncbi:hypothetical protein AVEN_85450-1 [Araneus ventricosus]|uniref:Uncharacterized protein n=1 Tax=Araneus ventricosus TaxID=182803 RepID=A0A4Y2GXZ7_ARAVE|nr:hypothetical protein AVEN_85450-1 [Araneus ventricosus]
MSFQSLLFLLLSLQGTSELEDKFKETLKTRYGVDAPITKAIDLAQTKVPQAELPIQEHQRTLNDSRCNRSSTEAGILMAITGHGSTPPEGGTYYHLKGVTQPPRLLNPSKEREPAYLSGGFSSTYSWCLQVGDDP